MMDTSTSRQRGGDPDGSSYLELDLIAITNANVNANSSQNGSIGPSVPSEVNINHDPLTLTIASSLKSSDP